MITGKFLQHVRCLNSFTAAITKPHRSQYLRLYDTVVVNPDGSSYTIRYHEPRKLITLPLNIWTLNEAERKQKLDARKPKKRVKIMDDIEDDFDTNKYLKYIKK